MKERKGQMNIKRHQVSRRRTRAWSLSPVIATQLALIMVLAGIGAAFALPSHDITGTTSAPWAGTASINESTNLELVDYVLGYTTNLSQVDKVTLNVSAGVASTADIEVVILNTGGTVVATDSLNDEVCSAGYSTHLASFSPAVDLDQIVTLNIVLTEP